MDAVPSMYIHGKVNNFESLYLQKPSKNYIILSMYCGPSGAQDKNGKIILTYML